MSLVCRTWQRAPEDAHPLWRDRESLAICFSGGGCRAMGAAAGQLQALSHLGVLERARYVSSCSGGGWATAPFTFAHPGISDLEMLGPLQAPGELTLEALEHLPPTRLGSGAPKRFGVRLAKNALLWIGQETEAWAATVTEIFLEPFGITLFGPSAVDPERIQHANPGVKLPTFTRPRPGRPCSLIHTCLTWPNDPLVHQNRVQFTASPLSMGTPGTAHQLTHNEETRSVGGGFIDTFAFGCPPPQAPIYGNVQTDLPPRWNGIGSIVGMGSAAYASSFDHLTTRLSPSRFVWPLPGGEGDEYPMNDGATADNLALLPLLSRDVSRILVFVNTAVELGMGDAVQSGQDIDSYLPPLFGRDEHRPLSHVFPSEAYDVLVSQLQQRKAAGEPLVVTQHLRTLPNAWWDVPEKQVEITWIYNDLCPRWFEQLPDVIQQAIRADEFPKFPFYRTIFEPGGGLLGLPARDLNLLRELASWIVHDQAQALTTT